MIQKFDLYGQYELPSVVLCNPNLDELYALEKIDNLNITMNYNDIWEISFSAYETLDGKKTPYYKHIQYKKYIKIENLGVFMITGVTESNDGTIKEKQVTAHSREVEMNFKRMTLLEGTFQFYNPISLGETIIGKICEASGWKVGEIHSDLWSLYRSFDVSDKTILDFTMSDVTNSYECVFVFDTFKKTISAYPLKEAIFDSGIFMSFDNLVESMEIVESTDSNVVTALSVHGGGGLDVSIVNPLGGNILYDFSYYKNIDWMSQDLVTALTLWEEKVRQQKTSYSNLLLDMRNKIGEKVSLETHLGTLKGQLKEKETVLGAQLSHNPPLDTSVINQEIEEKKAEIKTQETKIEQKKTEITNLQTQLKGINDLLRLENNLTAKQMEDLKPFISEDTYVNDSYLKTSIMNELEIQEMSNSLYEHGLNVLKRVSRPKQEFSVTSSNFIFLKRYKRFTSQLRLGAQITIDLDNGVYAYPILLKISFNYHDPESFELVFGNRLRLDGAEDSYADLFDKSIQFGSDMSFDKVGLKDWQVSGSADRVNKFINGAINCTVNSVVNSENQDFIIDQNGLRGRKWNETLDDYEQEMIWINNNTLLITNDAFKSAKAVLGKITLEDGNDVYGLIADVIVGKMVASEQLLIENKNNTFAVDGNGARLHNATFTLETKNNKGKIILDPVEGIKVQGHNGVEYEDKFYVNQKGDLMFKGELEGAKGTFTGELRGAKILGGSIDIGSGAFTVDSVGQCKANSLNITGGEINISETFKVDSKGNVTTKGNLNLGGNINMTGNISWGSSNSPVKVQYSINGTSNWHEIFAEGDKFTRYSYDGGKTWTNAIKTVGDNGTNGTNGSDAHVPSYIHETYIDSTTVKSPTLEGNIINGGVITGGTINQFSSSGENWGNCKLMGGRLQLLDKNNNYLGSVMGDNSDKKMWIEGMNALKLTAHTGDISLNPQGQHGASSTQGTVYIHGRLVVNGVDITDGGSAKFG